MRFGEGDDQIVVTGSGLYPSAGSTIAVSSTIVQPIIGGSGAYAGASGWAETEHLADDTWRHTFHLVDRAAGDDGAVRIDRSATVAPVDPSS